MYNFEILYVPVSIFLDLQLNGCVTTDETRQYIHVIKADSSTNP